MKIVLNKPSNWLIILAMLSATAPIIAQKPAIDWAFIPTGTFTMGSPRNEVGRTKDETQHQVTLSAFKMSKQEVTVKQFKTFVDATGYKTDAEKGTGGRKGSSVWKYGEEMFTKKWLLVGQDDANWRYDIYGKIRPESDYNHPVIHVSWNDVKAFADWMGCRLPTEAEWEYACRAGTSTPYHTGNKLTLAQAVISKKYPTNERKTEPVGSYPPNNWGLYDMHGNAMEWCSDWYGDYPVGAQTNPKGPANGQFRIFRGGSCIAWEEHCRSAYRCRNVPDLRNAEVGFRLVQDTK